jgi:hypothetical protein
MNGPQQRMIDGPPQGQGRDCFWVAMAAIIRHFAAPGQGEGAY